jgi:hypothetical protein
MLSDRERGAEAAMRSEVEVTAMIETAERRAEWAARALAAAAEELDQVAEQGVVVGSTAELARTESDCAKELARRIAQVGVLAGSDRRARDGL